MKTLSTGLRQESVLPSKSAPAFSGVTKSAGRVSLSGARKVSAGKRCSECGVVAVVGFLGMAVSL